MDMSIRSGDLLILHTTNYYELDDLIENKDAFETYRVILVMSDDVYKNCVNYHLLNPRFITTAEKGISDLKDVLRKLTKKQTTDTKILAYG